MDSDNDKSTDLKFYLDPCYYRDHYFDRNANNHEYAVASADECMDTCEGVPSCAAWTYYTNGRATNCHTKHDMFFKKGFIPSGVAISGLRFCRGKQLQLLLSFLNLVF